MTLTYIRAKIMKKSYRIDKYKINSFTFLLYAGKFKKKKKDQKGTTNTVCWQKLKEKQR